MTHVQWQRHACTGRYKGGRPTYRLTRNAARSLLLCNPRRLRSDTVDSKVGESHAIETAARLGLPHTIVRVLCFVLVSFCLSREAPSHDPQVKRAEQLLSEDQRQLLALQREASYELMLHVAPLFRHLDL